MKSAALSVVVALSALVSACVESPEAVDDSDPIARISINSLTPAQLFNANLESGQLTSTSVSAMASTADGRATLGYVIGCALPAGITISTTVGGLPYSWSGSLGLAPDWTSHALTQSERHWVSGCVLSRVNYFGQAVQISLRGAIAQLNVTAPETTSYSIQEGAFFGDVFQGKEFFLAACQGNDATNADRQCAQGGTVSGQTPCGLDYAGRCAAICSGTSAYAGCAAPNGVTYNEVVTTYLQPGS